MPEKMMIVTIGYEHYVGTPADIGALIELAAEFQMVTREKYDQPFRPAVENKPIVQSMAWEDIDFDGLIQPAGPALSWDEWLATARALPGGNRVAESDLLAAWKENKSAAEAIDFLDPVQF